MEASPIRAVGFLAMPPEELASVREIADLFGVSRQTALRYTRHEAFPAELGRVAAGPIWKLSDVRAWGEKYLPLPRPGRPRKSER